MTSHANEYVAFDCETTGLNPAADRLLSIGAVRFTANRIMVKESREWFVKQEQTNDESVLIHGILPAFSAEAIRSESEVVKAFLDYIGNATLVGHHINFDIAMINYALKRLEVGKLRNNQKDTNTLFKSQGHFAVEQNFSLDELCEHFNINASNRHTALGDAYITAQVFQRLI
jgi:DNA polymerase-3 subunit epsilon